MTRTIATIAIAEGTRHAEMAERQDKAEASGHYTEYDEYAADVNTDRVAEFHDALDIADHAGNLLASVMGDSYVAEEIGPGLNCREADRTAVALHLLGQTDAAVNLLTHHAVDATGCEEHEHLFDAAGSVLKVHVVAAAEAMVAERASRALAQTARQ